MLFDLKERYLTGVRFAFAVGFRGPLLASGPLAALPVVSGSPGVAPGTVPRPAFSLQGPHSPALLALLLRKTTVSEFWAHPLLN